MNVGKEVASGEKVRNLSPTRKTVSPPRESPYDVTKVLEYEVMEAERKLRVAETNHKRVAGITGVASGTVGKLEKDLREAQNRLLQVKTANEEPGYRYNLGETPPNIVKAEILVESCRPCIFVQESRIEKYEDVYGKFTEQCDKMLLNVPVRKNEEEDMMLIPRPDKFHLPRVGAFEIFLVYYQKPEAPSPAPQEEGAANQENAGGNTDAPPAASPVKKKKEPPLQPNLIRLFSKLQTKKWPSVAKVANAVRLFLPIVFDRLHKEAEDARIAEINARIAAAAALVVSTMEDVDVMGEAAEERKKILEEATAKADTANAAFSKASDQKAEFEAAIKQSNKNLKALEGELKQATREWQAAEDEVSAAEPAQKASKKPFADKMKTNLDRAESAVNAGKRDQKNAQADFDEHKEVFKEAKLKYEESNAELDEAEAELNAAINNIKAAEESASRARADQVALHEDLGEPVPEIPPKKPKEAPPADGAAPPGEGTDAPPA